MLFNKYQYSEDDIQKRGYSHHCIVMSEDGKRFWAKWILGIEKGDTKLKMLADRLRKLQGAKHSCLPEIIEYGFDEEYGAYSIIYSYLNYAESLQNRITQLDMQSIMSGLIDIAECLSFLHITNKISHGDIHPENIFVDKDGQFFLIDFQLAETTRMLSQEKDFVIFTAAFSAPEKLENVSSGFPYQSDIYSLGKIIDWIFREKQEVILEEQSRQLQRLLAEKPADRLQWQEVIDFLKRFPVFNEIKKINISFRNDSDRMRIHDLNSKKLVFNISPDKPGDTRYDYFISIILCNYIFKCTWKTIGRQLVVQNIITDDNDIKIREGEKLPFKVEFVENPWGTNGEDLSPYLKKWFAKKQIQHSLRLQGQEIKNELSFYRELLVKELEIIQKKSLRLQYSKWTINDDGDLLFFIKPHEKNSDRNFLSRHIEDGNSINSDGVAYIIKADADRKQNKDDIEFSGKPYDYEKLQSKKLYNEKLQDDEHDVFIFKIKDIEHLDKKKKESIPNKGYLFESTRQKEEEKRRQIDAITKSEKNEVQNSNLIYMLFNPGSLPPTESPVYDPLEQVYQQDNNGGCFFYSPNQNKAIRNALSKAPLSVIQGPPGTGKTTVITEIVFQILAKKPQAKILITSQTNNAVDQVLENLLKNNIPILRLSGITESRIKKIKEHTLHNKLDSWKSDVTRRAKSNFIKIPDSIKKELLEIHNDWINVVSALDEKSEINKKLIDSIRVIGATCNHIAAAKYRNFDFNFDYIIMDEAGKATIAESLVPLIMGNNLVFVGDHRQLRPTLTTTRQVEKWLNEKFKEEAEDLDGWDDYINRPSLFEQVITKIDSDYKSQLTECRRLPAGQVALTSKYFYESEGDEPIESVSRDRSAEHNLPLATNAPLLFIDIGSSYNNKKDNDESSYNEESAKIVVALLNHLNKYEKVKEYSFGVIACYKAQYRLLKRDIDRLKGNGKLNNICKWQNAEDKFTISVVDRFQGLERDIIILDLVKSGWQLDLGFMEVPNRINVALSRNKRLLIIVGDYYGIINATTRRLQGEKAALQKYLESIPKVWIIPAQKLQGLFK